MMRAKKIQQMMILRNHRGESLTIQLRQYREGDEEGMISCIRDEYENTYFRRELYDSEYIRKKAKEGGIVFLVAVTDRGEIAGMMILKEFYPRESACEIASQILRKKYRGFGLAMLFFEYGMGILLSRLYAAALCLPVMFHNVTQRLLQRLKMHATGMLLNVFDLNHIVHSYNNGRNKKHSQGIMIRALEKKDAGTLYIPEEHGVFCRCIYGALGAVGRIVEIDEQDAEAEPYEEVPTCSEIEYINDNVQHSLEIRVFRIGRDLEHRITELYMRYPLRGRQTAVLFLNCNDAGAVWGYGILKKMGYFFAGLKPLCGGPEYMVLHHPGKVKIYFRDYYTDGEFDALVRYIDDCYRQRCGTHTS